MVTDTLVVEGAVLFNWSVVTETHVNRDMQSEDYMYNSWGQYSKGCSPVTKKAHA